jgi:hypothetical protein
MDPSTKSHDVPQLTRARALEILIHNILNIVYYYTQQSRVQMTDQQGKAFGVGKVVRYVNARCDYTGQTNALFTLYNIREINAEVLTTISTNDVTIAWA